MPQSEDDSLKDSRIYEHTGLPECFKRKYKDLRKAIKKIVNPAALKDSNQPALRYSKPWKKLSSFRNL